IDEKRDLFRLDVRPFAYIGERVCTSNARYGYTENLRIFAVQRPRCVVSRNTGPALSEHNHAHRLDVCRVPRGNDGPAQQPRECAEHKHVPVAMEIPQIPT